ncbi:unnamed protein product, partial [Callosobruchus maculatus]
LQFLNIEQIIQEANLVLLFKIINKKAPNYFEKFMCKRMDISLQINGKALFIEGLKLYNKLPLIIKNSPNVICDTVFTMILYIYY